MTLTKFYYYNLPDTLAMAWNFGPVLAQADRIYQDCRFEELPILADALEDATCTEENLIGRSHEPGLHALGCRVLDLIPAKE